jgi:hypothetical protein
MRPKFPKFNIDIIIKFAVTKAMKNFKFTFTKVMKVVEIIA